MKRWTVLFILAFAAVAVFGQKQILLTIDTFPVYADEFLYMYKKNNSDINQSSVDQYLELFINYKLKVYEALRNGYNKDSNFIQEYHRYLLQAAEPFFKNKRIEEQLVRDFYNKSKYEVRFTFLMKRLPPKANADDTAQIYNELMQIRKKAIKGEDFIDLVLKYSDAPRTKLDSGKIPYVNIYRIPPQFIDFLWNAQPGQISYPIRYLNAYYLLRLDGKRPTLGKVHIAQIYIALPQKSTKLDSLEAYKKVHKIDSALKAGAKFEDLAKIYSDDYRTATKGGDMGWIEVGQTIPEFEHAAFSLEKPGDYTIVRTKVGFHFIKLIDKLSSPSFDREKQIILKRIKRYPQYKLVYTSVIDSLKKVYKYKQLSSLDTFYNTVDNSIFSGKWNDSIFINNTTPLFSLNDQIYTYADFARYLEKHQGFGQKPDLKTFINRRFDEYVTDKVKLLYVLDLAKDTDTDFGRLANEFYEGLLLFNITNDSVWKKAVKDTAGLLKFYKANMSRYDTLAYISVFSTKNRKQQKTLVKYLLKQKPDFADTSLLKDFDTTVKFVKAVLISPNDKNYNFVFSQLKSNYNKRVVIKDSLVIYVNDKFPQIRGLVVADYQDFLEKQWLNNLRKKYKITINKDVLDRIKKQLNVQSDEN